MIPTSLKRITGKRLHGRGGIAELLPIAFPLIVSQASDTIMMFVDRLFLSRVSKLDMAAAMSGGLTAFTMLTFFVGVLGYTNALVGQYLGAGRPQQCSRTTVQGLYIALLATPVAWVLTRVGPLLFKVFRHSDALLQRESIYFQILMYGAFLLLARVALSGFFAGTGRTRVIMLSNLVGMLVNVGANYVLIFGRLGIPPLGIRGAACGTLIGSAAALVVLTVAYLQRDNRQRYATHRAWRPRPVLARRLMRYGVPSGGELLLNVAAFNVVVQLLHSYGPDVAAAVTITFNWDLVAFVPMTGLNVAVMSLVGRHMGAEDTQAAGRTAISGLVLAYAYAASLALLFLCVPGPLVAVFTPSGMDSAAVRPLAIALLRLAAFYTLADATFLVFGGALRGAGDTRWMMVASVLIHWCMVAVLVTAVKILELPPVRAWALFVGFILALGLTTFLRFRHGAWKTLRVLEERPPAAPVSAAVTPEGSLESETH